MSVIHNDLIKALRVAGDEGLSEGEMATPGGRWWRRHVRDINRWKLALIGWDREDGEVRYRLVGEYDVESDRRAGSAKGIEGSPVDWEAPAVALSAVQPLFELAPVSAIDPMLEAA